MGDGVVGGADVPLGSAVLEDPLDALRRDGRLEQRRILERLEHFAALAEEHFDGGLASGSLDGSPDAPAAARASAEALLAVALT